MRRQCAGFVRAPWLSGPKYRCRKIGKYSAIKQFAELKGLVLSPINRVSTLAAPKGSASHLGPEQRVQAPAQLRLPDASGQIDLGKGAFKWPSVF